MGLSVSDCLSVGLCGLPVNKGSKVLCRRYTNPERGCAEEERAHVHCDE